MSDYMEILRQEFNAEDGSFLLRLRVYLEWDRIAFLRMVKAMREYCEAEAGAEEIKRWIAEGYWYIPSFTKDWISHPSFPKIYSEKYYQAAVELLEMLAYYVFFGSSPFETPVGFDKLIEEVSA